MFLPKLLISIGAICVCLAAFFFWQRYDPQRLAFSQSSWPKQDIQASSTIFPVEIVIPAINLDLPIIPASLEGKKWQATTKGISFLSSSAVPGTNGNSVLYGHNWPNLLGNITKLKPGQILKIKLSDGSTKLFTISTTVLVSPNQTSILSPSQTPQITLYTCTGFLDNQRFVVVAKPT